LPSLIYQLVLLASRGHKRAIISGIMSFFSKFQTSESQEPAQNGSKSGKLLHSVLGFRVYQAHLFTSIDLLYWDASVVEYEALTNWLTMSTLRRI
jgi:hypothetical protein